MRKFVTMSVAIVLTFFASSQSNVCFWDFNSSPSDGNAGTGVIVPISGTGSIINIGGTTTAFATGNSNDLNVSDNSGLNVSTWPAQGTNPKTAGAQFDANTTGYNRIGIEFWQRLSNTAANTWVLQYTLDNTGLSTGGSVVWTDATTYTFTPQPTGTGDTWYFRSFSFATVGALSNNPNAGFRVVSDFDPSAGAYLAARSTSTYGTTGTSRFDLVRIFEVAPDVSIASANNFAQYAENIGSINIPITVANANQAPINLTFSFSTYTNAIEGADFTWNNSFNIPASQNGVFNFPLTIVDDALAENAERIVIKVNSNTNANVSLTNNYQIIFIRDNDYLAPVPTNELNLSLLSSFSNGAAGTNSAEIIAFDPSNDRLYIANSVGQKLDIVNFSNPSTPVLLNSISLTPYGNVNSVVARNGFVAMAVESVPAQNNGKVVILDGSGTFVNQVDVGAMPDMITFNRDYSKLLTANEGEPNNDYSIDPVGSVSVIDLSPGFSAITNANVTTIGFTAYNGQEAALRAQGIRIFSTSASVAQDLEPEYIAVSENNTKAFVTLQENNALLTIDLTTNTIESLLPLGYASYATGTGNALDASDQSGAVLITGDLPVKGAYMPDAITQVTIGGQSYLLTANEGDSREFGSVVDANRISSATFNNLDAAAFPDQNILRNNRFLGRLSALKYSGDTDGDGDYDELHIMGGRSFSIWNASTGSLVFDSKGLIEKITAQHPVFGAIFNASNSIGIPAAKNRSDDKGPEPEGIAVQQFDGNTYAFVSLERIGGVMVFKINDPSNPIYVGYHNNRSTTVSGPDLGAEGIITISAADSPNGNDLVILANEVSSTLSIYQMQTCAQASGAVISSADNTICPGQSTQLIIPGASSTTYQWYRNDQLVPNATSNNLAVNQAGNYSVVANNSILGCSDESADYIVSLNPAPSVSAGNDQTICAGIQVALNASGANTYTWNNGAVGSNVMVNTVNQNYSTVYTVTGTDASTGCSASDQVTVFVNALPNVSAGADVVSCDNELITLSASGALSYSWTGGVEDGIPFSLAPGTASYVVTGTDVNGCESSDEVLVTIFAAPVVSADSDLSVCPSETPVLLTAASNQQNTSFVWNGVQVGGTLFASASGVYIVEGTNENGCSSNASVELTVFPLVTVDAGDQLSVCSDDLPLELIATTSEIVSSYDWSTGETNQTIEVNASGVYQVAVTDLNGCDIIDDVTVSVLSSPTVNAGEDQTVCEEDLPVTLNATGSGVSIEWSNGVQTPLNTVEVAGNYSVTVTAANGCQATDDVELTIESCLALDEIVSSFKVYPNPTTDHLNIECSAEWSGTLKVFSSEGKELIKRVVVGQKSLSIDVKDLSSGVYVIQTESDSGGSNFVVIKQ
ncbi:MAG: choice-of-anchor I family protein [Bacteroidota bacterium]|jgi:hypothetical protein